MITPNTGFDRLVVSRVEARIVIYGFSMLPYEFRPPVITVGYNIVFFRYTIPCSITLFTFLSTALPRFVVHRGHCHRHLLITSTYLSWKVNTNQPTNLPPLINHYLAKTKKIGKRPSSLHAKIYDPKPRMLPLQKETNLKIIF